MMRSLLALAVALPIHGAAQDLPPTQPQGKVEQVVGLTKVKVDYSRPSAKGRKIFGDSFHSASSGALVRTCAPPSN
ncbi:MAG: DUF2911 domain-containing protein [Flavobacteriales bacterium]|nr:DUF2911 domain-containing protein [Flavobacteriales bacterium]